MNINKVIHNLNSVQRKLTESIFQVQNNPEARVYVEQTAKEIEALEFAMSYIDKYYDHTENLENLSKKLGVSEDRTATEKMDVVLDRWYNDGWCDATKTICGRG